ncbi:hypothetical protein [Brevundimonas sp. NIBR11]|uniref:hypothetical protein n=1 Tax=Brevundimonas sp. NIBR11 TaxID=3015999 RepID=UPI0022F0BE8E|nr:hypothetical protein [Brevundimonas sp. NIBR11]WGM32237.1 hypothetical protein KKHFBJBL_02488 [Brevundimonas sp. NIBR11]
MTNGVRPVGSVSDRRSAQRREAERRAGSSSRELVPIGKVVDEAPDPASPAALPPPADINPADPAAAFAAQMYGQTGQRKGLKGGPPVMDAARASYLGAEYSGEKDRRPPAGLIKKTEL